MAARKTSQNPANERYLLLKHAACLEKS